MKKFRLTLVALLMFVVSIFGLASCGDKSYAGTYKFESVTVTAAGETVTVKAGEDYMGMSFSENFMVVELKEDGTVVMTAMKQSMEGTWEKSEADSGKIVITIDDEAETVECDGKTLKLEEEGLGMVTLKKS